MENTHTDTKTEKYHFKNDYDDYTEHNAKPHIENKSISAESQIASRLHFKWDSTLKELLHWSSSDNSVYTGTSGVGLLLLRKAPDDKQNLRVNKIYFCIQLVNVWFYILEYTQKVFPVRTFKESLHYFSLW